MSKIVFPCHNRWETWNWVSNCLFSAFAPRYVVPSLILLPIFLFYTLSTVDSDSDDNTQAPSVPLQRMITPYLMCVWLSHQYHDDFLDDLNFRDSQPAVPRSRGFSIYLWHHFWPELSYTSQPFRFAIPLLRRRHGIFTGCRLHPLLVFGLWDSRPIPCVLYFCQALGPPIRLVRAHAVSRTQCACQKITLDQYGNHVLTCKKYARTIAGRDHVESQSR